MGLFKSEGGRPATEELRSAGATAKSGVLRLGSWLVQMHYATTPVGKAETAHERGDSRFQIELSVDGYTMRTVGAIEAVGWHYEDAVDYGRDEVTTITNNPDGSSEVIRTSTHTGVYRFSRVQELHQG